MSVQGLPQLNRRLEAIAKAPGDIPREWAPMTVALAKRRVARKTGTTGKSIRAIAISETSARVAAGGAAAFLEGGTRPHDIVPKRRKVLRFPSSGTSTTLGGRVRTGEVRRLGNAAFVFARRVHHPGTKKQPFFFDSAREVLKSLGVGTIIERWNRAA